MRILFYTDPHNSDTPPLMRTDGYRDDILNKQAQILEASKKCDAVIIGGDIFHQKRAERVSHRLVTLIGEIYRQFPKTIIVPGNHDFENSIDEVFWVKKSPFATLMLLPNVDILHDNIIVLSDDVHVYGVGGGDDYLHNIEHMSQMYFKGHNDDAPIHIGVFHAPIANKKYPFETLKPVNRVSRFFHLVCLGHLHTYQEITHDIVSPGSLSRGVLRLDESYERDVGYALIDIIGEEIQTQFIKLNVRSADKVFKMNKREQKRLEEVAVSSLLKFIEKLDVPRIMSAESLMEHIKEMNLDYDVEQRALNILRSL